MSGTKDPHNPFVEWLLSELERLQISREELARRSGVGSSAITNIVSRTKNLGEDLAKKLANGLGVPQAEVFRRAGLLDDESSITEEQSDYAREITRTISKIKDPEKRRRIGLKLKAIAALEVDEIERQESIARKSTKQSKKGREGTREHAGATR